jgi:hypothetical protein
MRAAGSPGDVRARVRERLDRAEALLGRSAAVAPPSLDDDAALGREAQRLGPRLEALVGRPYGRLPQVRYRRGLGARIAGPWSQYLTLGHPRTRRVRMTPLPTSRAAIPTILAHELAHRYSFDESLTTLRGLEVSARLALDGDALHAHAAPRELARLLLGAAMAEAVAAGEPAEVERFLAGRDGDPALARVRAGWARIAGRGPRRRIDCVSAVYSVLPCAALEAAEAGGRAPAGPIPHPRFPLDSLQALAVAAYTGADALAGRRRDSVPVGATLELLGPPA